MKNQQQDNRGDALSKTLKEWRVETALPTGFQQAVWRKIDQQAKIPAHTSPMDLLRSWMNGAVTRPRRAMSYFAALVFIGVSVGWTQGHRESARVQNELAQRYVRSLDPYLTPRN